MTLLKRILQRWFGRRPADIPGRLRPEALERALSEARFLRGQHAVSVRGLREDETPRPPEPATDD